VEKIKAYRLMTEYMKLLPEERRAFDWAYANRRRVLRLYAQLRRATPEQVRHVRDYLTGLKRKN